MNIKVAVLSLLRTRVYCLHIWTDLVSSATWENMHECSGATPLGPACLQPGVTSLLGAPRKDGKIASRQFFRDL